MLSKLIFSLLSLYLMIIAHSTRKLRTKDTHQIRFHTFLELFLCLKINFCWMTNSLIGPIFLCIQGEKLLTLRLFEKYPCGKILGQSLVLPREYQNRVWKVSFLIPRKRGKEGKESRVGNTIRSCHYQTHSFAMNL